MRNKILEKLQAKKAGSLKKLSQKGLDLLLDKLAAKITNEDDIDSTIDDLDKSVIPFDDFVELIQKESDRKGRAVRQALEKDYDFTPKKKGDDDDDDEPSDPKKSGQQPDVAKLIAESIANALKPFQELATGIKTKQTKETLKAALKAKADDIPDDFADEVSIGEDFNQEETVERLATKWNNLKQTIINKEIGDGRVIKGSSEGGDNFVNSVKEFAKEKAPKEAGYNIQEI